MKVKQIDMVSALNLAAHGREVLVMEPNAWDPESWEDYEPGTLAGMLEGCLFFRKVPAEERNLLREIREEGDGSPDIPRETQEGGTETAETAPAEPAGESRDGSRQEATGMESPEKGKPGKKKTKTGVDTGELLAMHRAGWSNIKIAKELGVSGFTIRKYLKQIKEETDGEDR